MKFKSTRQFVSYLFEYGYDPNDPQEKAYQEYQEQQAAAAARKAAAAPAYFEILDKPKYGTKDVEEMGDDYRLVTRSVQVLTAYGRVKILPSALDLLENPNKFFTELKKVTGRETEKYLYFASSPKNPTEYSQVADDSDIQKVFNTLQKQQQDRQAAELAKKQEAEKAARLATPAGKLESLQGELARLKTKVDELQKSSNKYLKASLPAYEKDIERLVGEITKAEEAVKAEAEAKAAEARNAADKAEAAKAAAAARKETEEAIAALEGELPNSSGELKAFLVNQIKELRASLQEGKSIRIMKEASFDLNHWKKMAGILKG